MNAQHIQFSSRYDDRCEIFRIRDTKKHCDKKLYAFKIWFFINKNNENQIDIGEITDISFNSNFEHLLKYSEYQYIMMMIIEHTNTLHIKA